MGPYWADLLSNTRRGQTFPSIAGADDDFAKAGRLADARAVCMNAFRPL
jgi:hypothetical protein